MFSECAKSSFSVNTLVAHISLEKSKVALERSPQNESLRATLVRLAFLLLRTDFPWKKLNLLTLFDEWRTTRFRRRRDEVFGDEGILVC